MKSKDGISSKDWIKNNQGKILCQCGCNQPIKLTKEIYLRRHKHMPKYIRSHVCKAPEVRKKNSNANKGEKNHFFGKHHSENTKEILRDKNKGHIPWNKGIPRTQEERDKISKNLIGKTKGIPKSEEHKIKISKSHKGKHGYFNDKNPNWRGGISTLNHLVRTNPKTKKWIKEIFERDNYSCQYCKQIGWTLNAHHIKPVHQILKDNNIITIEQALNCIELWDLRNGITLCKSCHDEISKRR